MVFLRLSIPQVVFELFMFSRYQLKSNILTCLIHFLITDNRSQISDQSGMIF